MCIKIKMLLLKLIHPLRPSYLLQICCACYADITPSILAEVSYVPQEFCSQIGVEFWTKKPQTTAELSVPSKSKQRASFDGCFAEETALFIVEIVH